LGQAVEETSGIEVSRTGRLHHIADELIPKIRAGGYRGKFVVPLPEPRIVQ
jgi:hypothetical protein